MTGPRASIHESAALGFGRASADHERGRPDIHAQRSTSSLASCGSDPGIEALYGTAERMPFADASVDTVVVAQAGGLVSYIASLDTAARAAVLADVEQIVAEDPDTPELAELEMPYLTHVVCCWRL